MSTHKIYKFIIPGDKKGRKPMPVSGQKELIFQLYDELKNTFTFQGGAPVYVGEVKGKNSPKSIKTWPNTPKTTRQSNKPTPKIQAHKNRFELLNTLQEN